MWESGTVREALILGVETATFGDARPGFVAGLRRYTIRLDCGLDVHLDSMATHDIGARMDVELLVSGRYQLPDPTTSSPSARTTP